MKSFRTFLLVAWLLGTAGLSPEAGAQSVATPPENAPYNDLVLQQIRTMPQAGGYSANHDATQCLGGAVSLGRTGGLDVAADRAQPSYCSGATYLVFLKTVDALHRRGALTPATEAALPSLLINGQRDGEGVWGRWNANGPGTARLFYELRLGRNFSDFNEAKAGDFMKIFWTDAVGRREHGHSVVFLGTETVNGVESVRFWSSNVGRGYGEKVVPRSKIRAAVFSRLTAPQNLELAPAFSTRADPYLAGLLTKDSSLVEVRERCGM